MMGSGWPSGHVALDRCHEWPDNAGGKEICLNGDTCTSDELISEIDKLITELTQLRKTVPRRFAQWEVAYQRQSNRTPDEA